jgi:quinol monooxygenase YgiN
MEGLDSHEVDVTHKEFGMSKGTVRFVVDFTIADGQFSAFEQVSQEMTTRTQEEPGTLAYDWFLSADRTRCRLYENYIDGDAVLAHLSGSVVQVLVPRLLGFSTLTGFEVYGHPGPEASARLLGLGAELFQPWLAIIR